MSVKIKSEPVEKEVRFVKRGQSVVKFRQYLLNDYSLYRLRNTPRVRNWQSGRLYTPFVQLSMAVRRDYLYFDTQLTSLDIKRSFSLWVAVWLIEKSIPIDYEKFNNNKYSHLSLSLFFKKSIKLMKAIKFSDTELDFIRQQYQVELEEAETYVENLKNILNKIGSPPKGIETIEITEKKRRGRKPKIQIEPTVKVVKKRGPKPKVKIEPPVKEVKKRGRKPTIKKTEPIKTIEEKGRKPRSDKGKRRLKPVLKKSIQPTESETDKIFTASKKKVKRKRTYQRHGVILAPMAKPIKFKEEIEETPVVEAPPTPQVETSPEKVE